MGLHHLDATLPFSPWALFVPHSTCSWRSCRWGHTPLEAALTFQRLRMVKMLKAGGARLTASQTDFSVMWPMLEGWKPTNEGRADAQAVALDTAKISRVQAG